MKSRSARTSAGGSASSGIVAAAEMDFGLAIHAATWSGFIRSRVTARSGAIGSAPIVERPPNVWQATHPLDVNSASPWAIRSLDGGSVLGTGIRAAENAETMLSIWLSDRANR